MPRKSRAKKPSESPDDLKIDTKLAAQILAAMQDDKVEALREQIPSLTTADQLPRQLPPPVRADAEPEPRELAQPAPEQARPRPGPLNGTEHTPPKFTSRVRDRQPVFAPVPQGFQNVDSYPTAGVKVNRSLDKTVVAVQFAEDRLPDRGEKDAVEIAGLPYNPGRRQWERADHEAPAANIVDAKRIGQELADARKERGR